MKASMKYKCEDCYKSEKSCKCEKDTECENCGKGYNDSELLDGEMSIGETVCPHCCTYLFLFADVAPES